MVIELEQFQHAPGTERSRTKMVDSRCVSRQEEDNRLLALVGFT